MAAVTLDGIEKSFGGTPILKGVSLDVADGEFLTLVGPSGCGKSTLIRIIAGLETQDRGVVAIGGVPVDHLRPHERRVAMVFQSYALYPHMTVAANVALPLVMARLRLWERLPLLGLFSRRRRSVLRTVEADVAAVAKQLQLEGLLARRPAQLSGGQRQRVALGRAMVRRPDVFLMDEPLSNLDAKLRVHMRSELADLHARLGATFVYVTHDQVEAMTMSDRIAMMDAGRILQLGTPDELYRRPENVKVAAFIGSPAINLLPGRVLDRTTIALFGQPFPFASDLPPGSPVTVGLRPEAIGLDTVPGELEPGFRARARLQRKENLGPELILHLHVEGPEPTSVMARVATGPELPALGGELNLHVATAACHVFDGRGERIEPRPGFDEDRPGPPRSALAEDRVPA